MAGDPRLPLTSCKKGAIMHTVAAVFMLFLGGVAAMIIIRLMLFHFWGSFSKKNLDDQYLKRISDILQ
jgi:hypothetical protein